MQASYDALNSTTTASIESPNASTSSTISASTRNISDHMPDMISEHTDDDTEYMDDDPTLDTIFNGIDINSATQTYVLAEKFNITLFRDFQKQAIDATLDGKDTLIIQPTGQGKSLCYQFPALYTGKTTLVITPTISPMQDQTHELNIERVEAIFLGSARTNTEAEILAFDKNDPAPIIFVSPEWMFRK